MGDTFYCGNDKEYKLYTGVYVWMCDQNKEEWVYRVRRYSGQRCRKRMLFAAERLYNNFSSLKYALSKYPDDTESEKTVYQINGIQTPGMFNARTVIKIKRNPILPKSLAIEAQKTNGSCNEPDVIKQLKDDSNDKCYIQENIRRWKKRIEQQEIQELMESLYI